MARISILIGAALIVMGPVFYFIAAAESRSGTAFIPSGFGLIVLALGLVAAAERSESPFARG